MIKSVDFSNETIERLADGDRWETVARHVRAALVAALRELSWPRGDVQAWRGQAYAARLAALREAEKLQHPRRLSAVNVAFEYGAACGEIRNAHAYAVAREPATPEATMPLPVPEACLPGSAAADTRHVRRPRHTSRTALGALPGFPEVESHGAPHRRHPIASGTRLTEQAAVCGGKPVAMDLAASAARRIPRGSARRRPQHVR
jgi:hypothetical protein